MKDGSEDNRINIYATPESYFEAVKQRNRETHTDGHEVEFTFTDEQIDANRWHFEDMRNANISPYKALIFLEMDFDEP